MSDPHEHDPRHDASQDASHGASQHGANDTGASTSGAGAARTVTEEFRVSGECVISEIKKLVRQGNVRRIAIKNDEGRSLIEIPLTVGVIGTLLLPVWAAIGAIAALAANLTLSVERREGTEPMEQSPEPRTNGTA